MRGFADLVDVREQVKDLGGNDDTSNVMFTYLCVYICMRVCTHLHDMWYMLYITYNSCRCIST